MCALSRPGFPWVACLAETFTCRGVARKEILSPWSLVGSLNKDQFPQAWSPPDLSPSCPESEADLSTALHRCAHHIAAGLSLQQECVGLAGGFDQPGLSGGALLALIGKLTLRSKSGVRTIWCVPVHFLGGPVFFVLIFSAYTVLQSRARHSRQSPAA